MTRTAYIYTLSNPKTMVVFYIGAAYDIEKRLMQHMAEAKHFSKKHLNKYLNTIAVTPLIDIIDEISVTTKDESLWLENYWIDQFRQWGFALTNNRYNLSKPKISYKLSDIRAEPFKFLLRYKLYDIEKAMK